MHFLGIFFISLANWVIDFKLSLWNDGSWHKYWSLADWLNSEDIIYVKFVSLRSIIGVVWEIKGIKIF